MNSQTENKKTQTDERLDNIGFGNLRLLQRPGDFCYGIDAVLLADFAAHGIKNANNAVDLGCGTGIIPLILSHKTNIPEIYGVELQHSSVDCARKTVELNSLTNRIVIVEGDIGEMYEKSFSGTAIECLFGGVDMVCTNPPYFPKGCAISGTNIAKSLARQESTVSLDGFIICAASLLKNGGDFFMIHRPWRLADIFYGCRIHSLEPKTMRFISPSEGKEPNLVMVHCRKNGGHELKIIPTLFVHKLDGGYTNEIQQIYERA